MCVLFILMQRTLHTTLDNVLLTQELAQFTMLIASRVGMCRDPASLIASKEYQHYTKTWPTSVRVETELKKPRVVQNIIYIPRMSKNITKTVFFPIFRKRYPALANTRCWAADGKRVLRIGYM